GWDPKETAALVTWLIFAVYLHARGLQPAAPGPGQTARPRRRRSWLPPGPWIVVLGFAAVLFTYLGVNLWISGLHSYAGV
ncbi:MAG: cytochrome c biogenesis protein CcsA, partial [Gammaproteobacteria bacterium]|nr:cytochrome c biogenesis protein CcsA [Gammaproteobacteria bacterium]